MEDSSLVVDKVLNGPSMFGGDDRGQLLGPLAKLASLSSGAQDSVHNERYGCGCDLKGHFKGDKTGS